MKTLCFRLSGLVAGLAALAFVAGTPAMAQDAGANKPAQPGVSKAFGDWTVQCFQKASVSRCEMLEILADKKSGRRVLGISIQRIDAQNRTLIQIAVPLRVLLQSGVVLSSDTFTSDVLRYRLCDGQGCYAGTLADDATIKALGQATKAQMKIVFVNGKKIDLNFSLNGFAAAHNALLEMSHDKAAPAVEPGKK